MKFSTLCVEKGQRLPRHEVLSSTASLASPYSEPTQPQFSLGLSDGLFHKLPSTFVHAALFLRPCGSCLPDSQGSEAHGDCSCLGVQRSCAGTAFAQGRGSVSPGLWAVPPFVPLCSVASSAAVRGHSPAMGVGL